MMTKQLELFDKSKKKWEDDFNSSQSREYSFDTISGELKSSSHFFLDLSNNSNCFVIIIPKN
jgi:hypothetical protein